jgi:TolB-like protein/tetratricopeptide (TPR) repeat protein/DNA-binding winged helix-turn-helix (wHTH) protein
VRKRLLRGFYLGEYLVEPVTGKVSGPGSPQHLPSKAVEVLLHLADKPRSLISREALLESVWGEGGASNEALSHAIGALRHAFDDHADDPKLIQTLPKRGYRLLLDPRYVDEEETPSEPSAPDDGAVGLFAELRRRGVIETGLAYLLVGWLLIQIADVTFDNLGLPSWTPTFVTFLVIAGFPIALLLAWFLDMTDRGLELERDAGSRPAEKAFSKTYLSIVGALLLASIGVYVYDQYVGLPVETIVVEANEPAEIPDVVVEPNSIAVLPLMNIDGSEEATIFGNGLMEDVINRLARVPGLRVASRGDSFSLPANAESSEVRRRLRVNYYIEGSVRVTDKIIRVVIQLIESESGRHLHSRSFDRERKDFFEIQDEITSLTIANLRVALPEETQTGVDTAANVGDIDAYVLYQRGREELYKPTTDKSIAQALDWFRQSLEVDPEYAAAHAGNCLAYSSAFKVLDDASLIGNAEQSCATALVLSPNLGIVHNALGDLYQETGDYNDAEESYLRALANNPNDASALTGLAGVYAGQQKLTEAENSLRKAIALQPGNWQSYRALGRFLYGNGRYQEAAAAFREVVSIDATNMQGWGNLGTAMMLSGDFSGAAPIFKRSIDIEPDVDAYANLGLMHYYVGDLDAAIDALEKAVELAPDDHLALSNLGDALAISEQTERADQAFTRAEKLAESQLAVNRKDAGTTIDLAWIKAMLGKMTEAEELALRARKLMPSDPYVHYIYGLVLTRQGQRSAALAELETAVEMGYPLVMLAAEPHLKELKQRPRFLALVNQENVDKVSDNEE